MLESVNVWNQSSQSDFETYMGIQCDLILEFVNSGKGTPEEWISLFSAKFREIWEHNNCSRFYLERLQIKTIVQKSLYIH